MKLKLTYYLFFLIYSPSILFSQMPFWSEDFSAGFPAGWMTEDISENDFLWEHCDNFPFCAPQNYQENFFAGEENFRSSTAENGYLFLESFNFQILDEDHVSQLTTTTFDFSNRAVVVLKFETFIAANFVKPAEGAILKVKNENSDWVEFPIFPVLDTFLGGVLDSWNAEVKFIDITSIAANQSEVQIQWEWTGNNEWVWAIDDLAFYDYHPVYERVVWGDAPGEGAFDNGLSDWISFSLFDSCKWVWKDRGGFENIAPGQDDDLNICSHTADDGAAVMNPEFCFILGSPSQFSYSELISPNIDLSNTSADKKLSLRFTQIVQLADPIFSTMPMTSFSISLDGGNSWQDTTDVNPSLGFQTTICDTKTFNLPAAASGVEDFKVRFIFQGNLFFWAIDDVQIIERLDSDLQVKDNFFAIAPNFKTPVSQREAFGFLCDIENIGNLNQENIKLLLKIVDDENGAVVHLDSLEFSTIASDEIIENEPFNDIFLPPNKITSYTGTYEVLGEEQDENLENNIVRWHFEITEEEFAKEDGFITGFTPNNDIIYEIGNSFFIPNGAGWFATEIEVGIANSSQLGGGSFTTALYKWSGDLNDDQLANENEYEKIALNGFMLPNNPIDNLTISLPMDFENDCISLEDNTHYFATLAYENPVIGPNSMQVPLFIGASEKFDYNAMFFVSDLIGDPRYVPVLKTGSATDFDFGGFGFDRIPVVRMKISNCSSIEEEILPFSYFSFYPNPVSEELVLDFNFPRNQESINVEIIDLTGKIHANYTWKDIFVMQLPIEISELNNGSYILRVISKEGVSMKQFIVIH